MAGVLIVILLILLVVVLALAGLMMVRRFVPPERFSQHTEVAGYVYAVVGVLYAVILAQVVVAAWDEYREARDVAAAEASAVLNLDRLSRVWADPPRGQIQQALIDYARTVVEVEWPAMKTSNYRIATDPGNMARLWATYDLVAQSPAGESANYAASLDQLDNLDDARRNRILLGELNLPQTMTLTLLLGGVVTVGFSYLFAVESGWLHGLLTASLAVLVALLLLLEYQLQTPFAGVDAIEPTAMQLVLSELTAGNE
jgi:hypothetical protein